MNLKNNQKKFASVMSGATILNLLQPQVIVQAYALQTMHEEMQEIINYEETQSEIIYVEDVRVDVIDEIKEDEEPKIETAEVFEVTALEKNIQEESHEGTEFQANDQIRLLDIFEDPNLAQLVAAQLNVNINDEIDRSDLRNINILGANGRGIQSLNGIEYLTELSWLDVNGNQISNLEPLRELMGLMALEFNNNQVSDLSPLLELNNLSSLDANNNQISDLSPLSELVRLTWLDLSSNQISDIDHLKELVYLENLNLNDNQINSIKPLSRLENLRNVHLNNNQISDLRILDHIDTINPMVFISANYQRIQLDQIVPEIGTPFNLFLPNGEVPEFTSVTDTEFTFVDGILTWKTLGNNTLTWTYRNGGNFNGVHFSGSVHQTVSDDVEIDLNDFFEDINFAIAVRYNIDWSEDRVGSSVYLSDLYNMTTLNISAEGHISSINGIEHLVNLENVRLSGMEVSNLNPLRELNYLRNLTLAAMQISDLTPLSEMTDLEQLNLNWNKINDLSPLFDMDKLRKLELIGNQISDISPLSGLEQLSTLNLTDNQISDLSPLSSLTNTNIVAMQQRIDLSSTGLNVGTPFNLALPDGTLPPFVEGIWGVRDEWISVRGEFTFENQTLKWQTLGDNVAVWNNHTSSGLISFSGSINQTVITDEAIPPAPEVTPEIPNNEIELDNGTTPEMEYTFEELVEQLFDLTVYFSERIENGELIASNFTIESWTRFSAALESAREVLTRHRDMENPMPFLLFSVDDIARAEIVAALTELQNTYDSLVPYISNEIIPGNPDGEIESDTEITQEVEQNDELPIILDPIVPEMNPDVQIGEEWTAAQPETSGVSPEIEEKQLPQAGATNRIIGGLMLSGGAIIKFVKEIKNK